MTALLELYLCACVLDALARCDVRMGRAMSALTHYIVVRRDLALGDALHLQRLHRRV
jgi:hypothetical protein